MSCAIRTRRLGSVSISVTLCRLSRVMLHRLVNTWAMGALSWVCASSLMFEEVTLMLVQFDSQVLRHC